MDRILTPSGLPLFSAKEFTALAAAKNLPAELAVIQSYTADVETSDLKAAAADQKRFKFKISTDAIDRDKDVISVQGWDLAEYKKNPVVLYAHDYRSLPVGKSVDVSTSKNSLDAEVEFVGGDVYPFAETVRRMVQGGVLRAASVGFKPMKYMYNEERRGVDIEESKLLEWSIVPVPANPECLVQLSLMPKGIVDAFAVHCEGFLENIKGKGQWVVGVDLAKVAAFDTESFMKRLADEMGKASPKAMAGCTLGEKCPNAADGHPDTCPKGAKCPMIAANQQGGGKEAVDEDCLADVVFDADKADELILEDEADHVLFGNASQVDDTIRDIVRELLGSAIREAVTRQINYARGRVD